MIFIYKMIELNQDHIYNYIYDNINYQCIIDIIHYLSKDYILEDIYLMLEIEFDIEITDTIKKELKKKRNDKEFRKSVRERYNNKCIITGYDVAVCDVAHIKDFSNCTTDYEKYDINNGILLCKNMHSLFDKYFFSINPETLMVEVDKTKENVGLFEYNNKQVYIDENSKKYLMHHYDKFKN